DHRAALAPRRQPPVARGERSCGGRALTRARPPSVSDMLVARAPLRVPLAGGLTDIAPYAERFGGVTLSATISLAAHVTWLPSPSGRFEVAAEGEVFAADSVSELRHDLVRVA